MGLSNEVWRAGHFSGNYLFGLFAIIILVVHGF